MSSESYTERAEDVDLWKGACLACVQSLVRFPTLNEKKKKEEEKKEILKILDLL